MPDLLASVVARRTQLDDRYLAHAAHQSMTAYVKDWEEAYARLGRQLDALRAQRDERKAAKAAGTWPPKRGDTERQCPSCRLFIALDLWDSHEC